MSIFLLTAAMLLVLMPGTGPDLHGIGISLVLTVSGAWFIPGAAKQVLSQLPQNKGTPQQ